MLSKGVNRRGDGFTITGHNVVCSAQGSTCLKSIEISLVGSVQDTLTLSADSLDPEQDYESVIESKSALFPR